VLDAEATAMTAAAANTKIILRTMVLLRLLRYASQPNRMSPIHAAFEDRSLHRLRVIRTRPLRPALEHAGIAIRVCAEIHKLLMRQFVTN
jgi:hypothetical protein